MKHLSSIFAVIMLSFAVPAWLNAQEYAPVPVTISKEKVKVDGKVYYSHIVLERQTLYSISKAYNVTIDQIYEANPAVKAEGLKKNAIILIPETVQDSRNIPERQPKQRQKKTGSDEYIIHTVKWYENLEAISEKYGVPVEAIMEVNGLTGNKLRKRQKLMIPVGGTWSVQAAADTTAVQAAAEDSPVRKQEETAIAAESGKVNAVLVMPFDAHGLKPRTGSIDFYSGTLMAVKELGDRGADIDLNVYDAVYYAGDCNAGSKTIAINLPNDERVHALKGTRRLQLRNSMKAKFDKILMPIGQLIVTPEQQKYLNFDAFFWNVTFHEVAHGLGVKQTINTNESVDAVMGTEKTSWEEAKADILGLFMVTKLIEMGEITNITAEDAIATYIAGILRSVRFGAASSHGKANMMCFNYMEKAGAFSRDAKGQYVIDFGKAKEAMNGWAALILQTQGDGNVEFATKYRAENGGITPALQADLDKINGAGIPRDITFIQGADILLGETK